MGGYGSGGWNATGRPTTADLPLLDVNRLKKAGVLQAGWRGTWRWTLDAGQASVYVVSRSDCIVISNPNNGTGPAEEIYISWECCRFGGRRPFFRCPGCGQRTLHLYRWGHFRCRECHQLSYHSQRLRESDRAQRKANQIRVRLGGEPGWLNVPVRPKGMHRRTYLQLVMEIANADAVTSQRAEYLFG